ncbi:MAG: DEAD/DEAH box helicase [Sphingobacterium sp.]
MQQIKDYLLKIGISELNPMQADVLEKYDHKRDLVLLSPTGSGKTLAYILLMLENLEASSTEGIQGLIVVPTRELAVQIESVIRTMQTGLGVNCIYGGKSTRTERDGLSQHPKILIATPGRLLYHLERVPDLLAELRVLVLDEFDKSLELGFQDQLSEIVHRCSSERLTFLTSATDLQDLPDFIRLNDRLDLNYLQTETAQPKLYTYRIESPSSLKLEMLFKLICRIGEQRILVFCNHRETTEHITEILEGKGIRAQFYHGGMEQWDRELALIKLRNGTHQVLITTDLASRGLDIEDMNHVVHYQWPKKHEDYLHRNGRAGRHGDTGHIYGLLDQEKTDPNFFSGAQLLSLDDYYPLPGLPIYRTLRINAGKKQKINKIDIVGYLLGLTEVEKDDIGLITVKAEESFVAIRRGNASEIVRRSTEARIKKTRVRIRLV